MYVSVYDKYPRVARFSMKALIPKVHGSHLSLVSTRLIKRPSDGVEMETISPILWVKPSSRNKVWLFKFLNWYFLYDKLRITPLIET